MVAVTSSETVSQIVAHIYSVAQSPNIVPDAGLASPNFHPRAWDESNNQPDSDGFGINKAQQTVAYHRWGFADDGRLEKFYVVLNFSSWPQPVAISFPEDNGWVDLLSGWQPPVQNNWLHFQVGSNWGHIFYKKY